MAKSEFAFEFISRHGVEECNDVYKDGSKKIRWDGILFYGIEPGPKHK